MESDGFMELLEIVGPVGAVALVTTTLFLRFIRHQAKDHRDALTTQATEFATKAKEMQDACHTYTERGTDALIEASRALGAVSESLRNR